MKSAHTKSALATAAVAGSLGAMLVMSLLSGCSERLKGEFLPNSRPEVRLSYAPASTTNEFFYSYRFQWFGSDPDGTVDYFIYAVDPPTSPGVDTVWTATRLFDVRIEFRSDAADTSGTFGRATAFHTFVIKAVDNLGLASAPESRSFFTYTEAPSVILTNPVPNSVLELQLAPTVRFTWDGLDPDGITTRKPVTYKYILLSASSEFPAPLALLNPDSLRRYYEPDFAEWDSVPGHITAVQYTNLTPSAHYVFAIVAFDEAGAYSPVFSLNSNMLRFRVGLAQNLGPRIRFYNNFFDFTYPSGGYSLDPTREVVVQILPDRDFFIRWAAVPSTGATIRSYRWRLNGDVNDETPRANDEDVAHWSFPSLLTQSATLGPFSQGETHRLYVEAEDSNGIRSLGIVRIEVLSLQGTFSEDLLIVDDTRFLPDQYQAGCARPPLGPWPTAAELDTFLYARGGVPWRCYPSGTMSPPGIFAGYDYDTSGTKPESFSFATLARYKRVIWIVDAASAQQGGSVFGSNVEGTALRLMQYPGRINTLAAYLEQGGELWLLGGGAAHAATAVSNGALATGGFMHEFVKWRSSYAEARTLAFLTRSDRAIGDWPGAPDYARLPAQLNLKAPFSDPFPPGREGQSASSFYKSVLELEYLRSPNSVTEDIDPDPNVENLVSVLDTLYTAAGLALPAGSGNVAMTYYHGAQGVPVIMTGFDIWSLRRDQIVQLVDFVLQEVWGLTRSAPAAARGPGSPYGPRPSVVARPAQPLP